MSELKVELNSNTPRIRRIYKDCFEAGNAAKWVYAAVLEYDYKGKACYRLLHVGSMSDVRVDEASPNTIYYPLPVAVTWPSAKCAIHVAAHDYDIYGWFLEFNMEHMKLTRVN